MKLRCSRTASHATSKLGGCQESRRLKEERIAAHRADLKKAAEIRERRRQQREQGAVLPVRARPEDHSKEAPPVDCLESVPSTLMGALIGRGGENIKKLEADTGMRGHYGCSQPVHHPSGSLVIGCLVTASCDVVCWLLLFSLCHSHDCYLIDSTMWSPGAKLRVLKENDPRVDIESNQRPLQLEGSRSEVQGHHLRACIDSVINCYV